MKIHCCINFCVHGLCIEEPSGGHSTTTWTKSYPVLTHPTPLQKWTFYILSTLCHVTPRGLSTEPPSPSSCPRSYWMTPIQCCSTRNQNREQSISVVASFIEFPNCARSTLMVFHFVRLSLVDRIKPFLTVSTLWNIYLNLSDHLILLITL